MFSPSTAQIAPEIITFHFDIDFVDVKLLQGDDRSILG